MLQATRFAARITALCAHSTRLTLMVFGVLAPLTLFALLAGAVITQAPCPFEAQVLLLIHAQATPWLDLAMLLLSRSVSAPWAASFAVLSAGVLLCRRRWAEGAFWVLATGGAAALNLAAKHAFGRIRPDLFVSIAPETTYSFPSGHAMQSTAIIAALVILCWRTSWRWPALATGCLFVAAIGLSRVYLGVHYPSDILAGWSLALAWVVSLRVALDGNWAHDGASR